MKFLKFRNFGSVVRLAILSRCQHPSGARDTLVAMGSPHVFGIARYPRPSRDGLTPARLSNDIAAGETVEERILLGALGGESGCPPDLIQIWTGGVKKSDPF